MGEKVTHAGSGDGGGRLPFAAGLAFAVVVLATIVLLAMELTLAALAVILIDGVVAALWVLSAAGGGWWVVARATREMHGAFRFASAAGMGMGVYSLVLLGAGLAGWVNGIVVWGMFFGGLVAGAARLVPTLLKSKPVPAEVGAPAGHRWVWLVPAVSLGLALVGACMPPGVLWRDAGEPHPYDALSYHLQVPREWYEAGRITSLKHNVFSHFPMGVEVHALAGMTLMGGPWRGMYVAQFLNVAMAVVLVAGVYGVGRTLRPGSRWLPALAAAGVACVPWVTMLGSVAYAEIGLMLYGGLAVAWVLVALNTATAAAVPRGMGALAPFVIAGAFAGFACGTKYPAVPMLLAGAAVAMVAAALVGREDGRRASMPRVVGGAVAFGLAGLVTFSPWLVRNLAWTGNPVFPLAMRVLGQGHFTDEQVERFERAHAAPAERRGVAPRLAAWATRGWRTDADGQTTLDTGEFAFNWRYGFLLVPAGMLLALANVRSPRALFLLVMLVWLSVVWLGFTHLIGRFMVLSIPLIGIVVASLRPRTFEVSTAAVMLAVVAVVGWVNLTPMLMRAPFMSTGGPDPQVVSVLGTADLSMWAPPEVTAAGDAGQRVALVGDAQAFAYPLPMALLSYRTVFDVPPPGDVRAWHAEDSADVEVIVVPELDRLAGTYAHLAPAPPELRGRVMVVRPASRR